MQTTDGISKGTNEKVEVSTDGSTWTDISGEVTAVKTSGGEQMIGEQHVASGNYPLVVGSNKVSAVTVEVNIVYTETAGEAFQVVWSRYEGSQKSIYMRWSPKGGAVGDERYVCSNNAGSPVAAPIVSCLPPEMESGASDVAVATFSVQCPRVVQEIISS